MATDKSFIDFIVDQLENSGIIAYRKMFGEYALYSDGKVVALVIGSISRLLQPWVGSMPRPRPYHNLPTAIGN